MFLYRVILDTFTGNFCILVNLATLLKNNGTMIKSLSLNISKTVILILKKITLLKTVQFGSE